ncbi:hypothetical protein [Serratia surfactantfaciens]|uniref:Uncharacterized protein n=1 Tax=Serratia surfactantfaciens TaxID=2741499 RepID=A0ABS0LUF2_9GAMM|nr:hypothetical protein [Serratia surfactantfaciens]MBH1918881.1 hypothetical protein [Serratia surfactantfaciens]
MTEVLTYEALKAERDALQKRADALAVENAALKESRQRLAEFIHEELDTDYPLNLEGETPATDSALAAIRNEATARALKHLCDCQLISATVAELKATELREAK